jgi:hypothetical protein
MSDEKSRVVSIAAMDFFFFLNRGYPRDSALEWVGNRYGLTHFERHLLHRGVFGQERALRRLAKRCLGADWQGRWLVVDGHNVQITVESAILERPLLVANDGALRDLAGQSAKFRLSEASETAMERIFGLLEEKPPARVLFLFDAPMSHSGLLASRYTERLRALGLPGEARTASVPEREFPYGQAVVASSDGAVLDASTHWLDLARLSLERHSSLRIAADFSPLLLSRSPFLYNM